MYYPGTNWGTDPLNAQSAAVIVAHPDDETLWAGGTILMHPDVRWTIITLCRKSDPDRAPKFLNVLERLGATGAMGDLNDGPEQTPLKPQEAENTVLSLLPPGAGFDLILTHSPFGEYTGHRRHEETGHAVQSLWLGKRLRTRSLWLFAYEDGNKSYLPKAIESAHMQTSLPYNIFEKKYRIVTDAYGFSPQSYEARTTPRQEAFWCFRTPKELAEWLDRGGTKI
ncbi:MAG TPA: PIG-L family deacetylase [Spirochaetota bacterium]|nr:PIG-L family deacetylase [Spirochaetota bacterium]